MAESRSVSVFVSMRAELPNAIATAEEDVREAEQMVAKAHRDLEQIRKIVECKHTNAKPGEPYNGYCPDCGYSFPWD